MPIGVVSQNDFELELSRDNQLKNLLEIPVSPDVGITPELLDKGRKEGDNNVPQSLQKLIGQTAIEEGRPAALKLAESFGISASSVAAYSHGSSSTSTYNEAKPELSNHLTKVRAKIATRARGKLNMALRHITEDKLESAKIKDISGVAKDMASIIHVMEPPAEKAVTVVQDNGPKFVLYSPQIKTEKDFETVNADDF